MYTNECIFKKLNITKIIFFEETSSCSDTKSIKLCFGTVLYPC